MSDGQNAGREVYLYNLTDMTGKAAQAERRSVHFTLEMRRGTLIANLLAVVTSVAVMFIAFPIVRVLPLIPFWAVVIPGAAAYVGVLAVTLLRQRRGLRLSQWRAFYDKRRAQTGVFIQCGAIVDPLSSTAMLITPSSTTNDARPDWDPGLILDEVTA
ncbi:hypothetical protein ACIGH6_05705 [Brachybacterium paraconglomeratum]|uniref:hypothetical protein n=1 Tax=Brachybacterium paraconglomeratum TaxID=173362 RepID=UPI0037C9A80D